MKLCLKMKLDLRKVTFYINNYLAVVTMLGISVNYVKEISLERSSPCMCTENIDYISFVVTSIIDHNMCCSSLMHGKFTCRDRGGGFLNLGSGLLLRREQSILFFLVPQILNS